MATHEGYGMETSDDGGNPLASSHGDGLRLRRLHRAVMARVFDDEAAAPERIGRYEIMGAIGAGAMGSVYAAHDPELDRRVAVKLLHWSNDGTEGKRLLREAKALARLSHANVVQVYDAGATDDRVFLAMELVQGTDLHRWLRAEPRAWRDVVDVFLAAGRGLSAAHAVGLVHRDFKPQNVLVGDDGVVKVADFGLVRAADGPKALPAAPGERLRDGAVETLTRTGTTVGTPAYMAPEQHLGLGTDARTDQFSFCVALYEGLVGERPFQADRLVDLIAAIRADRVELPRRPWLPAALRRAVRRGLRANPADRFPDMSALLDALERARRCKRSQWSTMIIAASGLVPLAVLGLLREPAPEALAAAASVGAEPCDADAKARSIWDARARERVRAHLVEVNPTLGERAAATAIEAIDGYLQTWSAAYTASCEAEPAADEARVLAQRLCLQSRLQEVRGVISVLEQADAAIVASVPQIVAALEPVAQCEAELAVVRTAGTVDEALGFELARARSLWHTWQPLEAHAAAEALAGRAAGAGDHAIESDAWLLAGMIAIYDLYGHDRIVRLRRGPLAAALEAAKAAGDPTRMLRAEVLLAGQVEDDAAARASLERLAARVEASGDPVATWAYHHERLYESTSEAAKVEHARRMLEIATASFGAGHRLVERSREIARLHGITPPPTSAQQEGEVDEAAAMFGEGSPRVIEQQEELARRLVREGELDEARIVLERVVLAWTELRGPASSQVAEAWRQIGDLEWYRRAYEPALDAYERAAVALGTNPVTNHAGEIDALAAIAQVRAETLLELGRAAEAVAVLEEAGPRRHARNDGGLGHVMWSDLCGRARVAAGDPEGALAEHAAMREAEPKAGIELLDIGEGEALLALGRPKDARVRLRRAWTRLDERKDRNVLDEINRARAGLALARTLAALDAHDPEIATLAALALASLPIDEMSPPTHLRMRDGLLALLETSR